MLEDGIQLLRPQVRALQDVTAPKDGELSYKKGDIIDVEVRTTAEQWRGKLGSQVGTFRLDHSVVSSYLSRSLSS
jgi:Variant SH3 domain